MEYHRRWNHISVDFPLATFSDQNRAKSWPFLRLSILEGFTIVCAERTYFVKKIASL